MVKTEQRPPSPEHTLQHTATHCNTLQHTATHCNTLQHTLLSLAYTNYIQTLARGRESHTLQHTATRCNTLQHTTTHCNTLQHNATHTHSHESRKMKVCLEECLMECGRV